MRSIRARLLFLLVGAATVIIVLGAVVTYRIARQEVDAIFDYHLRQVALSVGDQAADTGIFPGIGVSDPELNLVIQIWSREGVTLYFSHPHRVLPGQIHLGYADVETSDGDWRVFGLQRRDRIVQVAQAMTVRQRLALSAALRILIPSLLLLPALAVGIWVAVGRGLTPLQKLAAALANRRPGELGQIALPAAASEIAPVMAALNDLLGRLDKALAVQRAFVADAAHELRTPLTALRLQVQLLERTPDGAARQKAALDLKQGLDRMTRVVEQLLTLARQEPGALQSAARTVDLATVARDAIARHIDVAVARGIDLGAASLSEPARTRGDPATLAVLLDNLLDNAIRYTPIGGTVDVTVAIANGRPRLEVSDSGPGIPAEERPHVFDRFYRGRGTRETGSGLGLAIVKAIADRHAAEVSLGDSRLGGLAMRVTFSPAGQSH